VERCLERISEASKKIGDEADSLCPGVHWAQLRGLGNLLRHEYDRVDPDRVWLMVARDLSPLKTAVEADLVPAPGSAQMNARGHPSPCKQLRLPAKRQRPVAAMAGKRMGRSLRPVGRAGRSG
jgi:hypothetical protein